MNKSEKEYYNPRHVSGLMPLLWVSILFGVGIILGDLWEGIVGTGMWMIVACGIVFVGLAGVKRWPNVSFTMILMAVIAFGGMRISLNEEGMEYEEEGSGTYDSERKGNEMQTAEHDCHVENVGQGVRGIQYWHSRQEGSSNARMEDKNEETCKILVLSEPVVHGKVIHFDGYIYEGSKYVRKGMANENNHIRKGIVKKSGLEGRKVRMSLLRDTVTGKYKEIHLGNFIKAKAEWAMLDEWHHTTSHFSYVRWQISRGFTRRAFVGIGKWEMKNEEWSEIGLWQEVQTRMMMLRQRLIDELQGSGMDKETYGVAAAMVLGDKSSLSRDIRDEYNKAGASHILALSGMHLMIIYMMLTTLLGRMRKRMELAILGLLWMYVMFVGMPISLVRATTMLSIYKVISLIGINQHQLNVVGFAALVILIANPQSLWDVGFQMSFMAVLFIILYAPYLDEMKPDRWKIKKREVSYLGKWRQVRYITYKKLWNMASVSIAAQLGTLPLSCYYFERIPCYFLISNFIVIPAAVVIICLMMVLVMGCIGNIFWNGFGTVVIWGDRVLEYVVRGLNNSQRLISGLPGSSVEGIDVNVVQVVLMYVIICGTMALVWKMRHKVIEGRWNAPRAES